MRKMNAVQMPGVPLAIQSVLNQIFRASQEADVVDIGGAFTISGTFTPTRTLNVTSPTLANAVAVLATLISDLQHGGATKAN